MIKCAPVTGIRAIAPSSEIYCILVEHLDRFGKTKYSLSFQDTRAAIEVFRPSGALGSDKYEDNIAGNKGPLQSVGLESKAR